MSINTQINSLRETEVANAIRSIFIQIPRVVEGKQILEENVIRKMSNRREGNDPKLILVHLQKLSPRGNNQKTQ